MDRLLAVQVFDRRIDLIEEGVDWALPLWELACLGTNRRHPLRFKPETSFSPGFGAMRIKSQPK